MVKCKWCGEELRFVPQRGWVHEDGGIYMVECEQCGWMGAPFPTPTRCPKCNGNVRDNHCAFPLLS